MGPDTENNQYLPHQQRVVDEKKELDDKIKKLRDFLGTKKSDELPQAEQDRLQVQLAIMIAYSTVLGCRIYSF